MMMHPPPIATPAMIPIFRSSPWLLKPGPETVNINDMEQETVYLYPFGPHLPLWLL